MKRPPLTMTPEHDIFMRAVLTDPNRTVRKIGEDIGLSPARAAVVYQSLRYRGMLCGTGRLGVRKLTIVGRVYAESLTVTL